MFSYPGIKYFLSSLLSQILMAETATPAPSVLNTGMQYTTFPSFLA